MRLINSDDDVNIDDSNDASENTSSRKGRKRKLEKSNSYIFHSTIKLTSNESSNQSLLGSRLRKRKTLINGTHGPGKQLSESEPDETSAKIAKRNRYETKCNKK
jgi:hypothetical protein